jgi:hypothetical protein
VTKKKLRADAYINSSAGNGERQRCDRGATLSKYRKYVPTLVAVPPQPEGLKDRSRWSSAATPPGGIGTDRPTLKESQSPLPVKLYPIFTCQVGQSSAQNALLHHSSRPSRFKLRRVACTRGTCLTICGSQGTRRLTQSAKTPRRKKAGIL